MPMLSSLFAFMDPILQRLCQALFDQDQTKLQDCLQVFLVEVALRSDIPRFCVAFSGMEIWNHKGDSGHSFVEKVLVVNEYC